MGQQVTGCSHRRQGPPAQMARSDRRRFTPATGTRASRRAPMSSVTVSSLSTAGPAPARTADRTAAVVDSASATGMVTLVPRAADRAGVSTPRVPDPSSRLTMLAAASSAGSSGWRRRAQG